MQLVEAVSRLKVDTKKTERKKGVTDKQMPPVFKTNSFDKAF